jgi:CheY-like chemotaxis protein
MSMPEPAQTVLVVDDDPVLLVMAEKVLAMEGYRVLTAQDPVRALPLIEWEHVDVVVADVMMPSMDGIDFLSRVRQLFPEVVRLLLTNDDRTSSLTKAINEAEVFRYLLKPFKAQELCTAVRLAFGRVASSRRQVAVDRASARRARELAAMERQCPGLSEVPPAGEYHLITEGRVRELSDRAKESPLQGWLP